MSLGNKLFELRKKSGFSQEELAEKLEVSRQTVSKWELNESTPDIKQAKEISKVFKISLDELVDNDIKDILTEKISNTERLAGLTIKILKTFGIVAIIIMFLIFLVKTFSTYAWFIPTKQLNCTLNGSTYEYIISLHVDERGTYNNNQKIDRIERMGGNSYLGSIIDIEKYEYYYQFKEAVYGYFEKNGGSCNDLSDDYGKILEN